MTLTIPEATRPKMKNYGIADAKDGLLTWDWVHERLEKSQNYWIATVRPDGRPHVAPVWGIVMDNMVYFSTDATSRKARNLAKKPNVVLHLESGIECVIIEGLVEDATDRPILERIAPIYAKKYKPHGFEPTVEELTQNPMYCVRPQTVMAWLETDFPKTATRWQFK